MRYDFAYAIEIFVRTVFRDYANFHGRIGRRAFWHFLSVVIVMGVLSTLPGRLLAVFDVLNTVAWVVIAVPVAAITVRRLHDSGRSGWWVLAPGVNLILACFPGQVGGNRFGADPLSAKLDAFA